MQDGKKVIKYMRAQGYDILKYNIVYIEDANADTWEPVTGVLDAWDDVRCVIKDTGEVLLSCTATTEPGRYYTENRLNPQGAFRIAFGNYKYAWVLGDHHGQEALVQCGVIKGHRDFNEDGLRTGDPIDVGDNFGVNQHTTGRSEGSDPGEEVGRYSAGCLVGKYSTTHFEKFIPLCKSMGVSKFDTTIIAGDVLRKWVG